MKKKINLQNIRVNIRRTVKSNMCWWFFATYSNISSIWLNIFSFFHNSSLSLHSYILSIEISVIQRKPLKEKNCICILTTRHVSRQNQSFMYVIYFWFYAKKDILYDWVEEMLQINCSFFSLSCYHISFDNIFIVIKTR